MIKEQTGTGQKNKLTEKWDYGLRLSSRRAKRHFSVPLSFCPSFFRRPSCVVRLCYLRLLLFNPVRLSRILTGIAIAEVPHSGNYFVMPVAGPAAGKIFYADHDGWYESAFANNFQKFLAHVTRKPVSLLNEEFGCYTRFSDGKTDKQWIPEEYFPDVSKLGAR